MVTDKLEHKRIGLFGGSFDPVHNGHIYCAQYILNEYNLSEVIFIPVYIAPHKQDQTITSFNDRFNMLNLAVEKLQNITVSDYEGQLKRVSYTADTVKMFVHKYALKRSNVFFIIGNDLIESFTQWKDYRTILNLTSLMVIERKSGIKNISKFIDDDVILYSKSPMIDVSSTKIRHAIANNKSINEYVNPMVANYIKVNKIYG